VFSGNFPFSLFADLVKINTSVDMQATSQIAINCMFFSETCNKIAEMPVGCPANLY
jgi:hypothetical protein